MNLAEYKGVWVFAEQRDGELQKVALQLVGKGRELADTLGVELTAVLLGSEVDDLAKELIAYGADNVLYADSPLLKHYTTDGYTKVIDELIKERKPEILLIGATFIGRDLGPRVAGRVFTGLTADCTGLDIDEATKNLMMTRPAFGGNLMATIACEKTRPQMSTVRPGVFSALTRDASKTGKIEKIAANVAKDDIRVEVIEVVKSAGDTIDISEADVIISGGRGLGGPDGFKVLKELADLLGGTIGGSRATIDAGWIDKSYQVGQTGKTVRPGLYVACGISGQIQHLAGMQDSGFIVAINKDENAPMMQVADLAIVGDLYKVVPEFVEQVKALNL